MIKKYPIWGIYLDAIISELSIAGPLWNFPVKAEYYYT